VARLGRPIENDRLDEGQADEAILSPFDDCGNEDSTFEADVNLRARRKVGGAIPHQPALRNVVDRKAARGAVDQHLKLAVRHSHSWMAALIRGW